MNSKLAFKCERLGPFASADVNTPPMAKMAAAGSRVAIVILGMAALWAMWYSE